MKNPLNFEHPFLLNPISKNQMTADLFLQPDTKTKICSRLFAWRADQTSNIRLQLLLSIAIMYVKVSLNKPLPQHNTVTVLGHITGGLQPIEGNNIMSI